LSVLVVDSGQPGAAAHAACQAARWQEKIAAAQQRADKPQLWMNAADRWLEIDLWRRFL